MSARTHSEAPSPEATAPEAPPLKVHHRVRRTLIALVAVVGVAGVFVVGSFTFRDRPKARSVDDAVEAFRTGSTVAPAGSFVQPAPGVYQAAGSGKEAISKPPLTQDDGATIPITVRLLDEGCWRWRIDYNTAHWHEYQFCPQGKGLIQMSQRNYQSWDMGVQSVTNMSRTTCDPPAAILVMGAKEGDTVQHRCSVVNSAAEGTSSSNGPSTLVGAETLTIGGRQVPTLHQRREITMRGTQRGTIDEDWWLEQETGLPVRVERSYDLTTDSVIGEIAYTEEGSWQLTSMTPET